MSVSPLGAGAPPPVALPAISLERDTPELAALYDEAGMRQFEHGKLLIEALGVRSGEHVLDVGCGTGRLGAYVANLVGPDGSVTGIDPLPLRVEIARRRAPANFHAEVGRAEDLSRFAGQTFDAVYLNSVFHWISDKPRVLNEIMRVLKPEGRIAVNSANPDRPHESVCLVRQALNDEGIAAPGPVGALHAVGRRGLEELLTDAGFVHFQAQDHTLVDLHEDAGSLLAWSNSSSFGNFEAHIPTQDRPRLRAALARLLESRRTPQGIRLERYLVFATAAKPAVLYCNPTEVF